MARNVCRLLTHIEAIKSNKLNLNDMPVGDLFRDSTFTFEDYEFLGAQNRFYSPEYINKIGAFIKASQSKL